MLTKTHEFNISLLLLDLLQVVLILLVLLLLLMLVLLDSTSSYYKESRCCCFGLLRVVNYTRSKMVCNDLVNITTTSRRCSRGLMSLSRRMLHLLQEVLLLQQPSSTSSRGRHEYIVAADCCSTCRLKTY